MALFANERYTQLARERAQQYATASPFPHAVFDDFLPAPLLDEVVAEFPGPRQIDWRIFDRHHSFKRATRNLDQLGPRTVALLHECNAEPCLRFLAALTGIPNLISDPYYAGGGLHEIDPGGFLKVHADFNTHPSLGLARRLNLIIYLNRDWNEVWGGALELWDPSMTRAVVRVAPLFNRCVIFSTTSTAYHGHPDPLACPPGRTRRSVALYYYTNGRPEPEGAQAHGTLWQERPQQVSPLRRVCGMLLRNLGSALERPAAALRRVGERWR